MKILFLLPETKGGGIATYYSQLIPELEKRGVACKVAAVANEAGSFFSEVTLLKASESMSLPSLNLFPVIQGCINYTRSVKTQLYTLLQEGFDLVEVTDYKLSFLPWLVQRKDLPVVIRTAGSSGQLELNEDRLGWEFQTSYLRSIENSLMMRADGVVAISKINQSYWSSNLNRNIDFIPPAFRFHKEVAETAYEEPFGIVIGRIQLWKGPEVVCEALHKMTHPPKIYWIGGDNYHREYTRSMSGYLKDKYPNVWGKHIIPLGRMPYAKVQEMIRKAGFVLVPSSWDTYNFTCVEAMGKKKIVVASDGVGSSMHITEGENGFIFQKDNADMLVDKVQHVLSLSLKEKLQIGENAFNRVQHDLDPEVIIPQRIRHYEQIIKGFTPKVYEDDWLEILDKEIDDEVCNTKILNQLSVKEISGYLIKRIKAKVYKS